MKASEAKQVTEACLSELAVMGYVNSNIRSAASKGYRSLKLYDTSQLRNYSEHVVKAVMARLRLEGYEIVGEHNHADCTIYW